MVENSRIRGKIIYLDEKGFGFITSRELEFTRIYFHWTNLMPATRKFSDLKRGDVLEFTTITREDRGTQALKIQYISSLEKDLVVEGNDV